MYLYIYENVAIITKEKEVINLRGICGGHRRSCRGHRVWNDVNIIFMYEIFKINLN